MLLPDIEQKLAERMKTVTILYSAFFVSIVVLTALPFNLLVPVQEKNLPIVFALLGVGAMNLILSFILPRIFTKQTTSAAQPEFAEVWSKFFLGTILGVALRESVAIFGLVSFMLTGDLQWPPVFGVAAIVAMIIGWPKAESLRARLR